MFQGSRPKSTQLRHLLPQLRNLSRQCDGRHQHASWGRIAGGWATSQETAYPVHLCREWAYFLVQQLLESGAKPMPVSLAEVQPESLLASRAATSSQAGKKPPPLVPEFKAFARVTGPLSSLPSGKLKSGLIINPPLKCTPALSKLPAGSKVIGPPVIQGGVEADPIDNQAETSSECKRLHKFPPDPPPAPFNPIPSVGDLGLSPNGFPVSERAAPSAHDEHCSSSSFGHLGFNAPGLPPVPA